MTAADYVVVGLLLTDIISAVVNGTAYDGVNMLGVTGLRLVAPYFIIRSALESPKMRQQALMVLVGSVVLILFFALIELRFRPQFYIEIMRALGISDPYPDYPLMRYGVFRARASFFHAIDLGNSAVLIFALITILASRSAVALHRLWIAAGLGGSVALVCAALSFTSFLATLVALTLFVLLSKSRLARRYLVGIVLVLILTGAGMTMRLVGRPLGERPDDDDATLSRSYWIRQMIVQRSFEAATVAGPFGVGYEESRALELESVDNAYILIAIQRGWVALGLWLALPLCIAHRASKGLRRARSPTQLRAIAAGMSGVLAIMIAMYTVFFGFVYSNLLWITMAFTLNAAQASDSVPRRRRAPERVGPAKLNAAAELIR